MAEGHRVQTKSIARVLVAGAGTMGSGIAQILAEAGIQTTLYDSHSASLDKGQAAIAARWDRVLAKGQRDVREIAEIRANLTTGTLSDAVDADFVIEAIVERLDAKTALFAELAAIAPPRTVFASNTSSLSIARLGSMSGRPDRLVGLHFFNPVPLLPLVEVVRGPETSSQTVATAVALAERLGKTAVVVNDSPGFVANRILLPMINEAILTLESGIASAEAIDEIMMLGMSHPMGPLALADLIGLDVCLDILETLHRDFADDKYRPAALLREKVAAGNLGRKSGRGFYDH